jgi:environmental stress-induced protein Ves
LAVIEGVGVHLVLPEGDRVLTPDDEPVAFAGEAAPACHLVDGPTRDLNLMLRRDGLQAHLQRARTGTELDGTTRWRGLYAAEPAVLDCDGVAAPVHAHTLVWSDDGESSRWVVRAAGRAWLLTVVPR